MTSLSPDAAAAPLMPGPSVTARAPAKVNLQLSIGPLRPDGYHDLVTVFCAVDLHDEVTVRATGGPVDRVEVQTSGEGAAQVPADASNLAVRAVLELARQAGVRPDVAISIDKAIPVAAGLAGGSADAAAALVAADALWDLRASRNDLETLAAGLGSDVPFALAGGCAIGTGRGEQLAPALVHVRLPFVLGLADHPLSTPAVYAELDRLRAARGPAGGLEPTPALLAALRSGTPADVAAALHNDLQPAACSLSPALETALAAGLDAGAAGALVSGSGPTCAFLAQDDLSAVALAKELQASGAVRSVVRAHGPVPGAAVVRSAP